VQMTLPQGPRPETSTDDEIYRIIASFAVIPSAARTSNVVAIFGTVCPMAVQVAM
jgi:hypothetical protein